MSLTELSVRTAKPKDKAYYLSDKGGLLLWVKPNGRRYWLCRVMVDGHERRRSLGSYPDVSLKDARVRCQDMVRELRNPAPVEVGGDTFADVAEDFMTKVVIPKCKDNYVRKLRQKLNCYILPRFAYTKLNCIRPNDVLDLCKAQEHKGHYETSQQIREVMSQVFKFAISMGLSETNPAQFIGIALQRVPSKHHPILPPEDFGTLIRALRLYPFKTARNAMLLLAYCFVRPSVVCGALWREVSLNEKLWVVPADRMKMGKEHIVPLSRQAVMVLENQRAGSDGTGLVFPSVRDAKRPMSVDSLRLVLRYLGFEKGQFNSYSFRPQASTILNEFEFPVDAVELQMAHADRNVIRAIYNHAEHLEKRTLMMQWYADYLDCLADRLPAPVKPF